MNLRACKPEKSKTQAKSLVNASVHAHQYSKFIQTVTCKALKAYSSKAGLVWRHTHPLTCQFQANSHAFPRTTIMHFRACKPEKSKTQAKSLVNASVHAHQYSKFIQTVTCKALKAYSSKAGLVWRHTHPLTCQFQANSHAFPRTTIMHFRACKPEKSKTQAKSLVNASVHAHQYSKFIQTVTCKALKAYSSKAGLVWRHTHPLTCQFQANSHAFPRTTIMHFRACKPEKSKTQAKSLVNASVHAHQYSKFIPTVTCKALKAYSSKAGLVWRHTHPLTCQFQANSHAFPRTTIMHLRACKPERSKTQAKFRVNASVHAHQYSKFIQTVTCKALKAYSSKAGLVWRHTHPLTCQFQANSHAFPRTTIMHFRACKPEKSKTQAKSLVNASVHAHQYSKFIQTVTCKALKAYSSKAGLVWRHTHPLTCQFQANSHAFPRTTIMHFRACKPERSKTQAKFRVNASVHAHQYSKFIQTVTCKALKAYSSKAGLVWRHPHIH